MTSWGWVSAADEGITDRGTGAIDGAARAGVDGRGETVTPFDRIVLIYNPHSTGDAPRLAEELHADLTSRLPQVPVVMRPTEHAGHARDLAREAARAGRPLIVSVSGDGGYNEVVNGVMQAGNDHAVCAVKAAGNANDHRRTTAERPLVDAVVAGEVRRGSRNACFGRRRCLRHDRRSTRAASPRRRCRKEVAAWPAGRRAEP